ncbi:MAG: hypothetical protein CMJ49_01515 [Planctomycetaceae bacterium]|nr:hypothetical protein [Planctomycetaceae bacterium]
MEHVDMSLIGSLYKLYLVDQQLRALTARLEGSTRHLDVQSRHAEQATQQHKEMSDELRHLQSQAALLENDVAAAELRVDHLREQMNSVRTNKEYSALLLEVNTLKADKSKIEDQAIDHLSRAEELKKEIEAVETHLAEIQRVKALAEKDLTERRAEVSDRLNELESERTQAAAQITPQALALFDRLADNFDGEAMAPVAQDDPRRMEFTCGGCFLAIPTEKINQLFRDSDLVTCTSCGRILYLEEDHRASLGTK